MPESERPRERLEALGAEALSATELIAIILGSGNRQRSVVELAGDLLAHFGGVDLLGKASVAQLQEVGGIGRAKALQLRASLALGGRAASQGRASTIMTTEAAYALLKPELEHREEERFVVVLLNAKAQLIRMETIAVGTLTQTLVHPREVFHSAVRHKAASLVVAHNHPSGDPTPSKADLDLTDQLIEAGRMMALPVVDHLIIGSRGYLSLKSLYPARWSSR